MITNEERAAHVVFAASAMSPQEIQCGLIMSVLAVNDTLKLILQELQRTGPKTTPFLYDSPPPAFPDEQDYAEEDE